jgi:predicted nucleotidyltransferase
VTKYANGVRSVLPVNRVILYGSYTKGNATDLSDVDIYSFLLQIYMILIV